jgi:uncharacterized protein
MTDNLIAHCEIPCTDLDKAKDFYQKVLGWEFKPFGNGYLLYNNHKGTMVGLRKVDEITLGDSTTFHINMPDIDNILNRAKENGGAVERNKTVIPAMGWYALFNDPDGNTIGLYQKS